MGVITYVQISGIYTSYIMRLWECQLIIIYDFYEIKKLKIWNKAKFGTKYTTSTPRLIPHLTPRYLPPSLLFICSFHYYLPHICYNYSFINYCVFWSLRVNCITTMDRLSTEQEELDNGEITEAEIVASNSDPHSNEVVSFYLHCIFKKFHYLFIIINIFIHFDSNVKAKKAHTQQSSPKCHHKQYVWSNINYYLLFTI